MISQFTQLADRHWFLAFIAMILVYEVAIWPFRLINRWIRHRNIATAGWPPSYVDADGDMRTDND